MGPRRNPALIRPLQLAIALAGVAFVAAHWATGPGRLGAGMLTFDTLWYHGPFAARIADTGSVWGLHFTTRSTSNWFYPQNSELLHGAGIALFDRDLCSPWSTSLARSRPAGRLVHRPSLMASPRSLCSRSP